MTELEFNQKRQNGWNPKSPENIPLFQHGEEPTALSEEKVVGYMWTEKNFDSIQEIGQTLDAPGDLNEYGEPGSKPTHEYGEGYIYTHRDAAEARSLLKYMERGRVYRVEGYGFDRKNTGLVSGGSLDQVERIFPVDEIIDYREMTEEELEEEPTLFQRINQNK
ncbi:MAG TPA: hypothetical protein GXX59_11485 [Syntrophomonadaceae bacterium]|nr:hypothetical protein [Syntrophomonadaceae bacterium]